MLNFKKFRLNLVHEDPRIWWWKLSSYSSSWNLLLYFSIKLKIIILKHKFSQLNKIVSGDLLRLSFSRPFFNASRPSSCWILGFSHTKSIVTSTEFSERFFVCFILLRKFSESLNYDHLLCITGFKWWSNNFEAFSVDLPQLD